jgi:hypothetical protein
MPPSGAPSGLARPSWSPPPTAEALSALLTLTDARGDCWRVPHHPERIQPHTPDGGIIARHRHRPAVVCYTPTANILTQQIASLEAEA